MFCSYALALLIHFRSGMLEGKDDSHLILSSIVVSSATRASSVTA